MFYAYLLESQSSPTQRYIGSTADLKDRVRSHNAGENRHTANFRPWSLAFYAAFQTEPAARDFESYLKSHTGRLFIEKRIRSKN